MASEKPSLVQRYIQYSKKITLFGMIQWCVIAMLALCIAVLGALKIGTLDEYSMGIAKTVVVWSATVAFISVGSYEVNSAIEKAVRQKMTAVVSAELGTSIKENDDIGGNG